ncbi:tetratricopeptide repeat protein [Microbacterium rhizomatis]|uniref:Tetratricopeptide repeat protein n=1 Tax=Microbacterium rhizomatis TaxID=1631477 RepID=A0A5J5J107_9MICO|nr:tetratricopeptide repeat protein [Microbacterium rhizomatis]KAA9108155.1 tetratricopeptide repeat protein [Microbacterium rhizomatis]
MAQQDLPSGRRYIEALEANGDFTTALQVCERMWDLGFPSGRVDAAWIVKDAGNVGRAIDLMTEALTLLDDEHVPLAEGVIGHWRWHYLNDPAAETQLRRGMHAYGTARADLAHLLIATGRHAEARSILCEGASQKVVECILPLARLLEDDGDRRAAEDLYRHGIELGDGHSAWNLAVLLIEDGRPEEAARWQWTAAEMGDELAIQYLADRDPLG